MQPGEGDALKKVRLTDSAGTFYDLIVAGGDKNMMETPLGASPQLSGGPRKFGDYDPSFGNIQVVSFERGWGNKDLSDDEARFKWGTNVWTLTRNKLYLPPKWMQITTDIGYLGAHNLSGDYAGSATNSEEAGTDTGRIINATNTQWASQFVINGTGSEIGRVTVWMKWNKVTGTYITPRVAIYTDSTGAPGSLVTNGASAQVQRNANPSSGQELIIPDVYWPVDFFFSVPPALSASTTYWIVVYFDYLHADDSVQLGDATNTRYGAGAYYNGSWNSDEPFMFSVNHNRNNRAETKLFQHGGAQFALRKTIAGTNQLFIMGEGGFATAGSSTTLTDTNMGLRGSWSENQWAGDKIKIVAGTGVGQIRTISTNTTGGVITLSGDNWDINPDSTSRYVIINPIDWYEITGHGLSNAKQGVDAGAVCYFPSGGSTNIRRMKWNTSATPLTFADDGTNKVDVLFPAGGRIWGAVSSTGQIAYSSIKAWGTNLAWTNLAVTTPIDGDFRGAGLHSGKVYFIKEDGIWFVDGAGNILYEFPVNMKYFRASNNGTAVEPNQEYLYFNWGAGLQRLSGVSVENVDPNKDEGMPEEYRGQVTGLALHPAGMFFSVGGNDDTRSTVNVYDGLGFHNVLSLDDKGHKITDIQFYYVEDDQPILFVATNETIIVQAYPKYTTNPEKDPELYVTSQGVLDLATIDMGGKALPKMFKEVALWAQNTLFSDSDYAFNRIRVYYNADNGGWNYAGQTASQQDGETVITFADTTNSSITGLGNVRELDLKLIVMGWTLGANDLWKLPSAVDYYNTPILDAITVKGLSRTPIKSVFSFPVDVSAVTNRLGSGDPEAMMAKFWTWAQSAEALLMTSLHPRFHNKTVIIIPRSLRTGYVDRSNESFASSFYLELREV